MDQILPSPAAVLAHQNRDANLRALAAAGRAIRLPQEGEPLEWVFGRDGSLTAQTTAGWLAGVSLPLRAARQQLKSMDAQGPTVCFLAPPHAAYLRVALDNLDQPQAVVALLPSDRDLAGLLSCEDFSADVAANRLWLVAGADWSAELTRLFRQNPGLATPTHFIRLPGSQASQLDPVIADAQKVFAEATTERTARAAQLAAKWADRVSGTSANCRVAIACNRRYRLWDDAGVVLGELAATSHSIQAMPVVVDDPRYASMYALLETATQAHAVFLADAGRADLPDLLPRSLPWISWITSPRVPSFAGAGPNDRLLLADPAWAKTATAAGWPASYVSTAAWPVSAVRTAEIEPVLAGFLDLPSLTPPTQIEEYSSQLVLWRAIVDELEQQPAAVGTDPGRYLLQRAEKLGVDLATLNQALFLRRLIEPAFALAIVRSLHRAGVPVRMYGQGWHQQLPEVAGGPVLSRTSLLELSARAAALLDVRPATWKSGLYSLGRPVVPTAGRLASVIAADVRASLAMRSAITQESGPILTAELVQSLLAGTA